MAYVYVHTCMQHVQYNVCFSTGGKFRPVSNFTELHALTLAAHSYALLPIYKTVSAHLLLTYLPTYPPTYPPAYMYVPTPPVYPLAYLPGTYLSVTEKPLQVCCHLVLGVNQSSSLLPQPSTLGTAQDLK